jgi:predicted ATPase
MVELGEVTSGERVASHVLGALPIPDGTFEAPLDLLTDWLERRDVLLVLDDCERLVEAVAGMAERLLRRCPTVRILATSREPLGVPGELVFPVPLLVAPDEAWSDLTMIGANEAVSLFVDRARTFDPAFSLNAESASSVVSICRALDGIPLAIELAASHLRRHGIAEIADLVATGLHRLPSPYRLVNERQQTMAATVDWSYGLLSEESRQLFRRLSVFLGWFDTEAASVVCAAPEASRVLDRLGDSSLLITADGMSRMLQPIRGRARELLTESGELEATVDRHTSYFLGMAADAEEGLRSDRQGQWIGRLERHVGEIRAALERGFENDIPATAEAVIGVTDFLYLTASYSETISLLRRCDSIDGLPPATRDRVDLKLARVLSKEDPAECLRILRLLADRPLSEAQRFEARLWGELAHLDLGSEPPFERVTPTEADLVGDVFLRIEARRVASIATMVAGDISATTSLDEEAYELAREHGLPWHTAITANNLAWDLGLLAGKPDEALTLAREAVETARGVGSAYLAAWPLGTEAMTLASIGRVGEALPAHISAMYAGLRAGLGERMVRIQFEVLAYLLAGVGDWESAALSHGAAHPQPGATAYFSMAEFHHEVVGQLAERLGGDVGSLEDRGRALSVTEVLERVT